MGKFAELYESGSVPQMRKFKVHAKDENGKDYHYDHESYSPRGIHRDERYAPAKPGGMGGKGHTLVSIKHDGKDVTNESMLDEALRKVGEYSKDNRKATVHRDHEWEEFRVKHHVDGVHQHEADYHTPDKEEAHGHAKRWAEHGDPKPRTEGMERSEFSANLHLGTGGSDDGAGKKHYIMATVNGQPKKIAGPFKKKSDAEKHPARRLGDSVHSE